MVKAVYDVYIQKTDGEVLAGQIFLDLNVDYDLVSDQHGYDSAWSELQLDSEKGLYRWRSLGLRQDLFVGLQTRLVQKGMVD